MSEPLHTLVLHHENGKEEEIDAKLLIRTLDLVESLTEYHHYAKHVMKQRNELATLLTEVLKKLDRLDILCHSLESFTASLEAYVKDGTPFCYIKLREEAVGKAQEIEQVGKPGR